MRSSRLAPPHAFCRQQQGRLPPAQKRAGRQGATARCPLPLLYPRLTAGLGPHSPAPKCPSLPRFFLAPHSLLLSLLRYAVHNGSCPFAQPAAQSWAFIKRTCEATACGSSRSSCTTAFASSSPRPRRQKRPCARAWQRWRRCRPSKPLLLVLVLQHLL